MENITPRAGRPKSRVGRKYSQNKNASIMGIKSQVWLYPGLNTPIEMSFSQLGFYV